MESPLPANARVTGLFPSLCEHEATTDRSQCNAPILLVYSAPSSHSSLNGSLFVTFTGNRQIAHSGQSTLYMLRSSKQNMDRPKLSPMNGVTRSRAFAKP